MQRFRICVFQVYLYLHELEVSPGIIWSHVYFIWSILHLLLRVYLIVISASKVHEAAHAPLTFVESLSNYEPRVIKVVPKSLRKLLYFFLFFQLANFEMKLRLSTYGLTGYGCFVVRRGVILGVI